MTNADATDDAPDKNQECDLCEETVMGYCAGCADYGPMDSTCRYCTVPKHEMGYVCWEDPSKGYFTTFQHCSICNAFYDTTLIDVFRKDKCLHCKYCNVCGFPTQHGFRLCSDHLHQKKRQANLAVERSRTMNNDDPTNATPRIKSHALLFKHDTCHIVDELCKQPSYLQQQLVQVCFVDGDGNFDKILNDIAGTTSPMTRGHVVYQWFWLLKRVQHPTYVIKNLPSFEECVALIDSIKTSFTSITAVNIGGPTFGSLVSLTADNMHCSGQLKNEQLAK
jgi:hypothetical protein